MELLSLSTETQRDESSIRTRREHNADEDFKDGHFKMYFHHLNTSNLLATRTSNLLGKTKLTIVSISGTSVLFSSEMHHFCFLVSRTALLEAFWCKDTNNAAGCFDVSVLLCLLSEKKLNLNEVLLASSHGPGLLLDREPPSCGSGHPSSVGGFGSPARSASGMLFLRLRNATAEEVLLTRFC